MHEVGVAHSILKVVFEAAQKNSAKGINEVSINIGTLSGVEPTSLQFALDAIKEGTLADSAKMTINIIKAVGICQECGKQSSPETFFSICAHCNSPTLKIVNGEEMEIEYIDIKE